MAVQVGYYGNFEINGEEFEISGVNCERPKDSIILYTNKFGVSTNTNKYGVELIVRNGIVAQVIEI